MPDTSVTSQRWLWQPRTKPIRLLEIHATRGDTTPELQMQSALNWVQSPRNVGNRKPDGSIDYDNPQWGSSFSKVIGRDGSLGVVLNNDQMPTYSAGYGSQGPPNGYAVDDYGISYEVGQSQALEAYSGAQYARLAEQVAIDCKRYDIPVKMLTLNNQTGVPPKGIVRHDRCENGSKLGKTDPGSQFDEARFIRLVNAYLQEEDDDMQLLFYKYGNDIYAIGPDGKARHITLGEAEAHKAAGAAWTEVDKDPAKIAKAT